MRLLLFLFLLSCQQVPTIVKSEVGGEPDKKIILADTRTALEYNTFHVKGSVSLNSSDFLILQNAKTQKRVLDPDLSQTIERLAKRGVSPLKTVILISDKKESIEAKKWSWLLHLLGIGDIKTMSIDEFRVLNRNLRPQPEPTAMPVWEIVNSKSILDISNRCFVSWSDSACAF